jgi:hypothetical protein
MALKQSNVDRLGHDIRPLLGSIDVVYCDCSGINERSEMMETNIYVLCPWSGLVHCCHLESSTVVFESSTMDLGCSRMAIESECLHLLHQSHEGYNVSER